MLARILDARGRGVWGQRKLSAEADAEASISPAKATKAGGLGVKHDDGSAIALMVTETLRKSLWQPSAATWQAPWSLELVKAASRMWHSHRVRVVAVNRDVFERAGLGNFCSVSQVDDGRLLTAKIGLFGQTELRSPAWHALLAAVAAESVLYHVARVQFMKPHRQAVQAEHFVHDTAALSKRLEVELAMGDSRFLVRVMRKTNAELMRHLCWHVDVDCRWEATPASVRDAIFCRIAGRPVAFSRDLYRWTLDAGVDLQTIEFHLTLALDTFHNCEERYMSTVFFLHQDRPDAVEPGAELRLVRIPAWRAR